MLHLLNSWRRLLNCWFTTLIIPYSRFNWITLEITSKTFDDYCMSRGIEVEHLISMFAPKMVLKKRSSLNDCKVLGHAQRATYFCIGLCNITGIHVTPPTTHFHPTLSHVIVSYWVRSWCLALTHMWVCCLCANCTTETYQNGLTNKDRTMSIMILFLSFDIYSPWQVFP